MEKIGKKLGKKVQENIKKGNLVLNDNNTNSQNKQVDIFTDEKAIIERNIARFSNFIFCHPCSNARKEIRTLTWENKRHQQKSSLKIMPLMESHGYTTTTLRYLLAFIDLWKLSGTPTEAIPFNAFQFSRQYGFKTGTYNYKILEREMQIMNGCVMQFNLSYYLPNDVVCKEEFPFQILSKYHFKTKEKGGRHVSTPLCSFQFTADFISSINSTVRLLNETTYKEIENYDYAVQFYLLLENVFSKKLSNTKERRNGWSRTATKLIRDDLHNDNKTYDQQKHRKVFLNDLKTRLNTKNLVRGTLHISVVETADKSDWKIVVKLSFNSTMAGKMPAKSPNNKDQIEYLISEMVRVVGLSDEKGGLAEYYARTYPYRSVEYAIGATKSDGREAKNKIGFFTNILHRKVHENGLEWKSKSCPGINKCKKNHENK